VPDEGPGGHGIALSAGDLALRDAAAWLDLSSRPKIRASGDDRVRLLHAMTTNHVEKLKPGEGCYALFLNAQGRILCDVNLFSLEDHILLDTEPETRQQLFAHLRGEVRNGLLGISLLSRSELPTFGGCCGFLAQHAANPLLAIQMDPRGPPNMNTQAALSDRAETDRVPLHRVLAIVDRELLRAGVAYPIWLV
jgi:hypothetical protein